MVQTRGIVQEWLATRWRWYGIRMCVVCKTHCPLAGLYCSRVFVSYKRIPSASRPHLRCKTHCPR